MAVKEIVWKGMVLPVIYWIIAAPYIRNSLFSEIYLVPDFHQAAVFFFPGIWFIMIFFIFYYYNKCRKEETDENFKNNADGY